MKGFGNYDKYPELKIEGYAAWQGYGAIARELCAAVAGKKHAVIVFDCYTEVDQTEVKNGLSSLGAKWFDSDEAMIGDEEYNALIRPFVTDDRVFGIMNTLKLDDVIDGDKAEKLREKIAAKSGVVCVIGVGASLICKGDVTVYLDLARWEIQCRFKKGASNWKTDNSSANKLAKFKQGFFVEWRMADRHKRNVMKTADYLLDTDVANQPKMITGDGWRFRLEEFASLPFRPGP